MASKITKDIRVAATSKIWLFATGMLAICIPLVAITHSGAIIPLVVMASAAISTVAVWGGFGKGSINASTKSMQEMEQRIANLETICSSQELELHSKLKRLESKEHI